MRMTEQEAKLYVKEQLKSYLEGRGINTSKNFHCISGRHVDRHPSMSYQKNDRVKCFACGFGGDLFDVLQTLEYPNLSGRQLFSKVYEKYGIEVDNTDRGRLKKSSPVSNAGKQEKPEDLSTYISACALQVGKTTYFTDRGLTQSVIERFGLGYDEKFCRGTGRNSWRAAIIPNGAGGYIARNTAADCDDRNRYRKAGAAIVFNSEVFFFKDARPAWLVEGEIDALSLETVGASCAALGSVANADKLIRMFESRLPERPVIIAMDADKAGAACTEKLAAAFSVMKIEYMIAPPEVFRGRKDANDALMSDSAAFAAAVQDAEESFGTVVKADEVRAREEYVSQFCAQAHLESFLGGLAVNTPCISTGFDALDDALGGGIFPGNLISIGAVSSLGKTTWVLQVLDSIAAAGHDVLFFSLEMARNELIAKSVSRISLEKVIAGRRSPALAKSARDIMAADRYSTYSDEEILLIDEAVREYSSTIADRVFIVEGTGNLGVAEIRAQVERHIAVTKKTPVVIVDYLQIMSPYPDHGHLSDKQNTDRSVFELRRLARDLSTPVLAISSFSRASYQTAASLSSFKETGLIEYSSDVLVAFQYRGTGEPGFDLTLAMNQNPRSIELLILKNRFGVAGAKIHMSYYPKFNYFTEESR